MKRIACALLSIALVFGVMSPVSAQSNDEGNIYYYSVLFHENNIPGDFTTDLASYGAEVAYAVPEIGFAQIKGNKGALLKVKELPSVRAANPSISWSIPQVKGIKIENSLAINTNQASLWGLQWDIQRVTENGASYQLGTGSHDVVVGIIDSGIDRDHPDLVANLLPGSKNFVPAGGFRNTEPDETGNPEEFDDKIGHGTHIAGTIAANGKMLGVAPNTGIRAYRVFGTSLAEPAWLYAAMVAAANEGVDVISLSLSGFNILGQAFYTDPVTGEKIRLGNDIADFLAYKRAIQYAVDRGTLVVAAAGNEAVNATNKKEVTDFLNAVYGVYGLSFVGAGFEVPGGIPGAVTVSATGPSDILALYSNYGPGFIDIAAPGGDIRMYLEYLQNGNLNEYFEKGLQFEELCLSTDKDGGYSLGAGTSMATPKVSAVAALIIAKYGKIEPRKVAEILLKKGVDPVSGRDQAYFGSGHLNAVNALKE